MNSRLKQLAVHLKEKKIDAFLATKDINIAYLTNFPAAESWLFVTHRKSYYITDFRYMQEARKNLKGATVKRYSRSIFETTTRIALDKSIKRIGFNERHLAFGLLKRLKKASQHKLQWIPMSDIIEEFRAIKTKHEISQIRRAVKLNLKAFKYIKGFVKVGVSEREVLDRLERFTKAHNVTFSFAPIVASGPNSSFPHAKVTNRRIRNNEPVLIDLGIDVAGYKSDLTRMFFLGKIPHLIREINTFIQAAQRKAIDKIRLDIRANDIDQEARNYLKKNKLARFFGHSLGHGVGLEVHESPTISSDSPTVLKEGMVFTVEPAVYIPDKFGVRIEDMVLVTKEGCEVLSDNLD